MYNKSFCKNTAATIVFLCFKKSHFNGLSENWFIFSSVKISSIFANKTKKIEKYLTKLINDLFICFKLFLNIRYASFGKLYMILVFKLRIFVNINIRQSQHLTFNVSRETHKNGFT